MKKHSWLIAVFIIALLAVPGLASIVHAQEDSIEEKSAQLDGLYTGTAERIYTSCLAGECETCPPISGTVRMTRGGGKVTIVTSGPDNATGPCRVDAGTTLAWTLKGTYETTGEGINSFTLNDCNNGSFPGSGSGVIEGDRVTVSFSCTFPKSPGSSEKWNNVVLTKQAGDDPAGEAGDFAENREETGTSDDDDFGQDPNRIKEGETDGSITVDRLVGDATVRKDSTYPSRHLITTGSRSKAKIHFGDSEIVIGPNSRLRVNTTENKLGQSVIMWEFLNPEAVIYVKDKLHGTRKEESGVQTGGPTERIYTNLWRSIVIFYNGSYDGKKDLRDFYGGETNQPEFSDPNTGERTVIVGIKGTEYYYQAAGTERMLYLTEGELDLYTDADDKLIALAAGEKVPVDEDGAIGAASTYTEAEIASLENEVDLEQPAEDSAEKGRMSNTTIAIIAAAGSGLVVLAIVIILILRKRKSNQ
ncbi:MAG: hypothetical protein HZB44_08290 [Actinobacteria bacterium]|nr:hypothetical protein [Actinomycetota bacterium]